MISVKKEVNDLLGYNDLKIIQCKDYFNFSLESVLLPNFININKNDKKVIDLGCGNAPMPLILNFYYPFLEIVGVELQKEIFELATDTIKINNLENKIKIVNMDINNIKSKYNSETFDIVITNPPYFTKQEKNKINENKVKSIARHEIKIDLENIIEKASFLLKNKGKLYLVHRTSRLAEIFCVLKKYNIEPKRIQFIYSKKNSESKLFLLEGKKNTGAGLKVLEPLIIHKKNGEYSKKAKKFFRIE